MSKPNMTFADLQALGLEVFDPAQYLGSDEAIVAYINEALAANDASLLASAIGDVARAHGMTEIAKSAGITREALYKALRQNSQPRMETIARVLGAMRLRLVVEPIAEPSAEVALVAKTGTRPAASLAKKNVLGTAAAKTKKVAAPKAAQVKPSARKAGGKTAAKGAQSRTRLVHAARGS